MTTLGDEIADIFSGVGQWGSRVEIERKRRIDVSAYAFAYEIEHSPLVEDAVYDQQAYLIRPEISTGHRSLDPFFRVVFSPHTGMWIHNHPDLAGVRRVVELKRAALIMRQDVGEAEFERIKAEHIALGAK